VNDSKHSVLLTVFKCSKRGGNYSKISIDSIQEKLKSIHNIDINRRWCFEINSWHEKEGYTTRRQRYNKNAQYPHGQLSSLISITLKGAYYLARKGVKGAIALSKSIMHWKEGIDNRWPKRELEAETFTDQEIFDNKGRLKALIGTLA